MTLNELIEKLVTLQPEHGEARVLAYASIAEEVDDVHGICLVDLGVRDKYDQVDGAPYAKAGYDNHDWSGKTIIIGAN